MDLENIEAVIWPTLHPWADRKRYLGIARGLPKPFFQVMRLASEVELHLPSLFLYNNTPFFGCVAGNNSIHMVELQTSMVATMEFRDYPGFEGSVSRRYLKKQSNIHSFDFVATSDPRLAVPTMSKFCPSLPLHIMHARSAGRSCRGIF